MGRKTKLDFCPQELKDRDVSCRYDGNRSRAVTNIPHDSSNPCSSILWSTVSKAALRSKSIKAVTWPESSDSEMSEITFISAVSVE